MLKNYIKIALRNLRKNPGYSFINIFGLAVGIAVCFTIFLWIQDELKHDRFHEHAERIYRVLWDGKVGDNEWVMPAVPVPVGETLEQEFPEVQTVTNLVINSSRTVRQEGDLIRQSGVIFADPEFFNVFTPRFLDGDSEAALNKPNSVVLTKETARKYFDDIHVAGYSLELDDGRVLEVTGVVEDWPKQSHLNFEWIEPLTAVSWLNDQRRGQWGSASVHTYFMLQKGQSIEMLQEKLDRYVRENVAVESSLFAAPGNYTRFHAQPLTGIHLYSRADFGLDGGGDIRYVLIFSVVGIFILILASINFVNLTTARSLKRMREIGLRKVLGSVRPQLIRQFLAESFVYVTIAVLLAVVITELWLPLFSDLAAKEMNPGYFSNPLVLGSLAVLTVLVGLMAGGYPAFHLSSFLPVQTLKEQPGTKPHSNKFRNALVAIQFCVSISLIIGTLIVHKQLDFMQNTQLGFDKEQVVVLKGAGALQGKQDTFMGELQKLPGIVTASATRSLPGYFFDSTLFELEQPANYEQTSLSYTLADYNFVDVLGLEIVKGRNFSRQYSTDSTAYLINETAAKAIGWENPVGKTIDIGSGSPGQVIGVVEDFHFESLHSEIKPLVIPFMRWRPQYIAVRMEAGVANANEYLNSIEEVWEAFVPQQPFDYVFLDQNLQNWYENEIRIARLFRVFALLTLFIACLGLFGLAAYAAERRTKEIGIRKVLGAKAGSIVALLNREFLTLVVIGFLVASPVAWYAMNLWLQDFAYRIEIAPGIFALAGGAAVLIALMTVSWQAIKAALMNPVDSLRSE